MSDIDLVMLQVLAMAAGAAVIGLVVTRLLFIRLHDGERRRGRGDSDPVVSGPAE